MRKQDFQWIFENNIRSPGGRVPGFDGVAH